MGASDSTLNETPEVKLLKHNRDQLTEALARFSTFLNKFSPEQDDIEHLKIRLEKIEPTLDQFKDIQSSIQELFINDSSLCNATGDELAVFEESYYDVIALARKIQQTNLNESSAPIDTSSNDTFTSCGTISQVPSFQLPQFSGAHHEWSRFHDIFMTTVHDDNSLSNHEKFNCLKNCLTGELAENIASLPDSQANFATVWQILKDRFGNRKMIVDFHLKKIVHLPVLSKESHTCIKNLHNKFLEHVEALESLGENVKDWDTILIYLVISKLDFNSKREWENFSKDIRYHALEAKFSNSNQRGAGSSGFRNSTCSFCKGSHHVFACQQFKNLSVDSRLQRVIELKMCKNCLKPGHNVTDCHAKHMCKKCGSKHATLLHQPVVQQESRQAHSSLTPQAQSSQATVSLASVVGVATTLFDKYFK